MTTRHWGDYWRRVCAPKLKARKEALGRGLPEREIAAYVESKTGKSSERALVNLWLLGEREPYISQFFALCEKLEMSPLEVLREGSTNNVAKVVVKERRPKREVGSGPF